MKILHVISDLDCHAAAKQLTLLSRGLADTPNESEICVLGTPGVFSKAVDRLGISTHYLNWRRSFDLWAAWQLRKLLGQSQPNVIHVWGSAYWALPIFGKAFAKRSVLAPCQLPQTVQSLGRWVDRNCLQNVHGVFVRDVREESLWRTIAQKAPIHKLIPAVETITTNAGSPHPWRDGEEEPRIIAMAGRQLPTKGYKSALLAFDMIRHVWPDTHLLLMGDGEERERIGRYARGLFDGPFVHFIGASHKVNRYFGLADVVWAPDERDGGQNAVLEAMSMGKPVVASNWPLMRNIVLDRETGFLIPPGDAPALARKTYALLQMDADERGEMGETARRHVEKHFTVERLVGQVLPVYERIAA